jgi:Ca-activated chloride channel family protein
VLSAVMQEAEQDPLINLFRPRGQRPVETPAAPAPVAHALIEVTHRLSMNPLEARSEAQVAYALLDIKSSTIPDAPRMPLNLCLVLDQSHSMRGEKFTRVQDAAGYVIEQMSEADVISIVTFNDRALVVCPPRFVNNKDEILAALAAVRPRGGTELAAGLEWGISQLHDGLKLTGQAISSVLLLTDGRTYGDDAICLELADYSRKQGFLLTALGVGDEWNEDLLEGLASKCGSRSEYIDGPDAIVNAFREHMARLQHIVGYNTRIAVRGPGGARINQVHRVQPVVGPVEALLAAEPDEQVFELGTLLAGETQSLLLETLLPALAAGEQHLLDIVLSYQHAAVGRARTQVKHAIGALVAPPGQTTPAVNGAVKSAVEKVLAYRLQKRAWDDVAEGNIPQAVQRLRVVADRLFEAGETELAANVRAEAEYLERFGQPSPFGPKQIKYGTRGLGSTQGVAGGKPATG